MNSPTKTVVAGVVPGILALILLFGSWTIILPGHRGIVVRLGHIRAVYDEGIHLKVPLIESVQKIDVRTGKDQVDASAASKDLQDVQTTVAMTDRIDPQHVAELYQAVGIGGNALTDTLIVPSIQESLKATTAQFTAEELVTKRDEVKEKVRLALKERLAPYHIVVEDVSIVNFKFSKTFEDAIEAKVAAEQQALAAKNQLEQVKFEAQQKIETAKAEAESIRIQAEALKQNPDLVNLKAVEKWDGKLPTQMIPGSSIPFLNVK